MSNFSNSSNFVVNNSSFVEVNYRRTGPNLGESCSACGSWLGADDDDEGQQRLQEASLFDATYDSAAQEDQDPPLRATHDGHLIEELDVLIARGELSSSVLIFSGPRSNLGLLCAKRLEDNLCASFFVSQSLKTDDHVRFFPTIAWQISVKFPAYSSILERELRRDPSILRKKMKVQFQKLVVDPVRELLNEGHDLGQQKVIVIEGLEEYGKLQTRLEVCRLILGAAEELPFVWLIFGLPDESLDRQLLEMGVMTGVCWDKSHYSGESKARSSRGRAYRFTLSYSRSHLSPYYLLYRFGKGGFFFFF